MSSRYHRLLIYGVKRTNKIDGMGPFNYNNTRGLYLFLLFSHQFLLLHFLQEKIKYFQQDLAFILHYCGFMFIMIQISRVNLILFYVCSYGKYFHTFV